MSDAFLTIKEIYQKCTHEELIDKLEGKNKLIESAEKTITDQELEIKDLNQDIKNNTTVQALYKKVKDLNNEKERMLKDFQIEREQHQNEVMILNKKLCKC